MLELLQYIRKFCFLSKFFIKEKIANKSAKTRYPEKRVNNEFLINFILISVKGIWRKFFLTYYS